MQPKVSGYKRNIMSFSKQDLEDLQYAKNLLENPSLAAKFSNLLGSPIEKGFELLPAKWYDLVQKATKESLQRALHFAVLTIDTRRRYSSSEMVHKILVAATGAGGGAFGLTALAIELPVSTIIMLRSIADIARSEGENIKVLETRLACLEVFAFGGTSKSDDRTETGYFAIRTALAHAVSEAAQYIAERGLSQKGAPALMRFIAALATRFGVVVSEKVAAQAIPLVGAAGGAIINTLFIDHFQDIARGHFIVRRLERAYGKELVRHEYEKLAR
jgi:predicted outer membrane lipoprotein